MNRSQRIALASLALLLLVAMSSRAPSQEPRAEEHQQAPANKPEPSQQQQIESPPLTRQASNGAMLDQLRSMQAQEKAQAEQDRADRNSWCSPSVVVQLLLFLVGTCYTVFAWRQWTAIREQATIANDSLIETRKAADAATTNAKTAEQIMFLDQRPWVVATGKASVISTSDFADWPVFIELKNAGKTPARNLTIAIDSFSWGWDEPIPNPSTQLQQVERDVIGAIGPGVTHDQIGFIKSDMTRILENPSIRKNAMVCGLIEYRDHLSNQHTTTFSLRWLDNGSGALGSNEPGRFVISGPYNDCT